MGLKSNADRLYFEEISVHLFKITDHSAFCPLSESAPTGGRARGLFFYWLTILQDSVKFQQETFSLFFSLSLSLFLNCS